MRDQLLNGELGKSVDRALAGGPALRIHHLVPGSFGLGLAPGGEFIEHVGPHGVRLRDHDQRLSQTHREPLLRSTGEIQVELAVHPPQPLWIPRRTIQPQSIATLPETPATLGRHERGQGRDHRRIALGSVQERPIVRRPS